MITHVFGITKVNGYTFLPGPMISDPYKKETLLVKNAFISSLFLFAQDRAILTISFVFILKNNVFKIKVFLLVAVDNYLLSYSFRPSHLNLSFGFDQKTLHFDFLAGNHCHLS